MKMKVLLLRSYTYIDKGDFPEPTYEPLGLEYLASVIRDKHEVIIVDCIGDGWWEFNNIKGNPNMLRHGKGPLYIKEQIQKFGNPDVIGITFLSLYDEDLVYDLVKKIKKWTDAKIVVGGVFPSTMKENILKKTDCIDILVVGDGENIFKELLDSNFKNLENIKGIIFKKKGEIIFTGKGGGIENLDNLPLPSRDLVNYKNYTRLIKYHILHIKFGFFRNYKIPKILSNNLVDNLFGIMFNMGSGLFLSVRNTFYKKKEKVLKQPIGQMISSRGCPLNCVYCAVHNLWGKKYRARSAENVLKEIDELIRRYNVKTISFLDDNFAVSKQRLKQICKGIIEKGYNINLDCGAGVYLPSLDEESIILMKRAGFQGLSFGIETGSQRVMDEVIGKYQDLNKVKDIIKICRKHKLKVSGFFMIGIVGETLDEMKQTIKFAGSELFDSVNLYICQAFPNSRLYKECVEKGFFIESYKTKLTKAQRGKCYFRTKEFNPEDVEKLFSEAVEKLTITNTQNIK